MTAKRTDPPEPSGKARPRGDRTEPGLAQDEALLLLERLTADLAALRSFVAEEQAAITRKAPSPKRLARLRLVGDDLASAVKLSSKSFKG